MKLNCPNCSKEFEVPLIETGEFNHLCENCKSLITTFSEYYNPVITEIIHNFDEVLTKFEDYFLFGECKKQPKGFLREYLNEPFYDESPEEKPDTLPAPVDEQPKNYNVKKESNMVKPEVIGISESTETKRGKNLGWHLCSPGS